jgi:threonine dehydrogenase-like Zn-dependent dehydrogenase
VVCSFIPNCGVCRYCATGRQSICDMGATILEGYLPGERFPITGPRGQYGAMCMIGTFSQYGVISQTSAIKVDDDLPLDKAVLVGCGVPTGWGSAVNTANVAPGDTVAIYGIGGIGINAVRAMSQALAEDPAVFELLAAMTNATDERLRAAAIRLGSSIVLERARGGRVTMRGISRLRPVRGAADGDLDIDASIEGISAARSQARPVALDDLTTLHWARAHTAFAVVVDRSGSMNGARLAAAATVAAACALRAARSARACRPVFRRVRRPHQAPSQRHRAGGGSRAAAAAPGARGHQVV